MLELREAEGGLRLRGRVVPWNTIGHEAVRPERFARGAFGGPDELARAEAVLNIGHRPDRAIGRIGAGLELRDEPEGLMVEGALPDTAEARDAMRLVAARVLTALSPEFVSLRERRAGGVREILRARLAGLAIVAKGAHDTWVEARAAERPDVSASSRRRLWL